MRSIALLLLVAACGAPAKKAEEPSPEPPPVTGPEMDEAQWRAEAKRLLAARHLALAKQYRDALEIDKALQHVDQALLIEPSSEPARTLKLELQRMTGQRSGEVSTMLEDEWLAMQAREEQRIVETQRLLSEARTAEAAGDLDRAAELYKRAAYLAREK